MSLTLIFRSSDAVTCNNMEKEDIILETASLAGHILLENGAEISRVEETMERIASHYGVESENFFVLSNGIFTTGRTGYAKVEFIPFKGAQLERVVAVNQVSRDIASDKLSITEAYDRLQQIRSSKPKRWLEQLTGSAVGSAGFCVIFGGGLMDALSAMAVGLLLWAFVLFVSAPYLTKILGNLLGGLVGTVLCLLFYSIGFGENLGNMIVGSLIPLIPGVAFTNGIRDLADEDYIAGATRLLDALMVFFCIAAGVVLSFGTWYVVGGSMPAVYGALANPLTSSLGVQAAAAFIGTLGFAVLFGVPSRNYLQCGAVACIGWIVYLVLDRYTALGIFGATVCASMVVVAMSRWAAVWFRTPGIVYLITGVFPMIPGGAIFWATFFLVDGRMHEALKSGLTAVALTFSIVLGIVLVSSLPKSLFRPFRRKKAARI